MVAQLSPHPPHRFDDEPAPYDESELLTMSPLGARDLALKLPLTTRFELRDDITPLQFAFLDLHGFLIFAGVLRPDELSMILSEMARVERKLIDEDITSVCGVPVWFALDPDGNRTVQRMGFSSYYSDKLEALVTDARFEPVRRLIGEDARIGTREKDGVVFNSYINTPTSLRPNLGWHTDSLRDIAYNREMPGPMLNVGFHFDRIKPEDGGLRLIPGTHKQSAWPMLTRKLHFLDNKEDKDEVMVETWPGDLTLHDGRMWHRVKASPHVGAKSLRRSMYVPYVVDRYQPKDASTKTNAYMLVLDAVIKTKAMLKKRKHKKLLKATRKR